MRQGVEAGCERRQRRPALPPYPLFSSFVLFKGAVPAGSAVPPAHVPEVAIPYPDDAGHAFASRGVGFGGGCKGRRAHGSGTRFLRAFGQQRADFLPMKRKKTGLVLPPAAAHPHPPTHPPNCTLDRRFIVLGVRVWCRRAGQAPVETRPRHVLAPDMGARGRASRSPIAPPPLRGRFHHPPPSDHQLVMMTVSAPVWAGFARDEAQGHCAGVAY